MARASRTIATPQAPPATGSATVTFTATGTVVGTGVPVNTAHVSPPVGTTDPNGANDAATDSDTQIQATADLSGAAYHRMREKNYHRLLRGLPVRDLDKTVLG